MAADALKDSVAALWSRAVGPAIGLELTPCRPGGNNRTFFARVGGQVALAKWYFRTDSETRDRLDAEWRFLSYAAALGIAAMPRPLARDDAARLALHEFCAGTHPDSSAVGRAEVAAAAALFRTLNAHRHQSLAADLPDAAEACFSAASQIDLVDGRIRRLSEIPDGSDLEDAAHRLADALSRFWDDLKHQLPQQLREVGIDPDAPLPEESRCLSPSDFGFHNALIDGGAVRFIDFEYAGWDDPAKMLCDFFLQPAVPVVPTYRDRFFAETLGDWPDRDRLQNRARLMQPLFALKWCCIMLNPFVPDLARRGQFADPAGDDDTRRRRRLAGAAAAFHRLQGS